MRYRGRHRIEYVALRAAAGLFRILPYRAALLAAWHIAFFAHFILGFRRVEALRRIRLVLGPELPARRAWRIAWISWRNICFNVVDLARLPGLQPSWYDRHMDRATLQAVAASAAKKGAVIAVPHAGNWDLAGLAVHREGAPVFFIARRQRNPLTDAYLNRMRNTTGAETVLTGTHMYRHVLRKLRAGGCLAILPDVRSRSPALSAPFLGGMANLAPGMALFARRAGVPVIPAFLYRHGWTQHRIRVFDAVLPDPDLAQDEDLLRITRRVMARFDTEIRARPEQYFWYNKRWVLDPPG